MQRNYEEKRRMDDKRKKMIYQAYNQFQQRQEGSFKNVFFISLSFCVCVYIYLFIYPDPYPYLDKCRPLA